jgi:GNAT superfamily N-acetyltransferase
MLVAVPDERFRIEALTVTRMAEAVGVLSRGMRDNPNNVAAFGRDPARRQRCLERIFGALFRVMRGQQPLCAREGETVIGVGGVAPSDRCQPDGAERLRLAPAILASGPASSLRVLRWTGAWGARDPDEPHLHLGPLAVEPHLRGRGIGSQILGEHCRHLDEHALGGYLETDKRENVRLYERFGYRVVAETSVIGVPNWFMWRQKP